MVMGVLGISDRYRYTTKKVGKDILVDYVYTYYLAEGNRLI